MVLLRRLFIALSVVAFGLGVVGATTYYVRTDGNNSTCNGLQDGADPNAPNCAFATIQYCVNQSGFCVADGRCQVGVGTFPEMVVLPIPCQGTSGHPWVIDGASRTTTIIDPDAATQSTGIRMGGNTDAQASAYGTISDMQVNAGYQSAISCHWAGDTTHELCNNITIQRVDFREFGTMRVHTAEAAGSTPDALIIFSTNSSGTVLEGNILIDDILVDGNTADACLNFPTDSYSGGAHLCGSHAPGVYGNRSYITIQNSTFKNTLGQVARLLDHAIFQGNTLSEVMCDGDDGCLQLYNARFVIIRRNLFYHVNQSGVAYDVLTPIRMRRTRDTQPITSAEIYNNTFVGEGTNGWGVHDGTAGGTPPTTTICTGATSACPVNSIGTTIRRKAIDYGSPDFHPAPGGPTAIVRNLFINQPGQQGQSFSVLITPGQNGSCPTPLYLRGNIYFNVRDSVHDPLGCITSWIGDDDPSTVFSRDPGINRVTLLPDSPNDAACAPYGTGYTAWDGDTADQWAGYAKGSCTSCGNGIRDGLEECDRDSLGWSGCDTIPPPYGWCTSGTLACNANCTYNISACTDCGNFYPFSCRNGQVDAPETDVDCGGGTCAPCALGKKCLNNSTPYVNLASSDCEQGKGPGGRLRNRKTIYCHQTDCATGDFICTNSSCPEEP